MLIIIIIITVVGCNIYQFSSLFPSAAKDSFDMLYFNRSFKMAFHTSYLLLI